MERTIYAKAWVGGFEGGREIREIIVQFDGENITFEDEEADLNLFIEFKELMRALGEAVFEKGQSSGEKPQ